MKKTIFTALVALISLSSFAGDFINVTAEDRAAICTYLLEENYQASGDEANYMLNHCLSHSHLNYTSAPSIEERTIEADVWFAPYYTHHCTIEMSLDQVGIADCK